MEDGQLSVASLWAEDPEDKNALYYQFERAARLRSIQYPVCAFKFLLLCLLINYDSIRAHLNLLKKQYSSSQANKPTD
jgi:hypothetical protein